MIPNRDSLQEFSAGCFFVCFGRGENKRNYSSDEKENGCIPDVTIGIIDVLRDKNTGYLQVVREIEKLYADASAPENNYDWSKASKEWKRYTDALPHEAWIA